MKLITQLGIIFLVCIAAEAIALVLPSGVPVSVLAMVLMFLLLLSGVLKLRQVEQTADFMLSNMAILFIPAGVGIINIFDLLRNDLIKIFVLCIATTILTFGVTALVVSAVLSLQHRLGRRRSDV